MARTIIGLCGYKGCGKTTAAEELYKIGYTRIRFAQGLKAMLLAFGLTEAMVDGDQKEVPTDLLMGQTPRHAMQTLGGDWGRGMIAENLWVENWKHRVLATPEHVPIVADDLRYPNEVEMIQALGGDIVMITRPGFERSSTHASEDLSHITPDYVLPNNGSIEAFLLGVRDLGIHRKQ